MHDTIGIGIIGLGFVGRAIKESLESLESLEYISVYDPYLNPELYSNFESIIESRIIFLCLPTCYSAEVSDYDYSALTENLDKLSTAKYKGLVVIKSTIAPDQWLKFGNRYPSLRLVHNPEFLSARTATSDFLNQHHIVIGSESETDKLELKDFYTKQSPIWSQAKYSLVSGVEASLIKLSANSFYGYKVTFFNMLYQLTQEFDCDYDTVRNSMINNGWINSQHTQVPGTDGYFGYGGSCLTKDSQAFNSLLQRTGQTQASELYNRVIDLNNDYRWGTRCPT